MTAQHTPGRSATTGHAIIYCTCCLDTPGDSIPATHFAPQIGNEHWDWLPICEFHASTWWDGGNPRDEQSAPLLVAIDYHAGAAAPAMLAALEAFLAKHDDRDGMSDLWPKEAQLARSAIALARGTPATEPAPPIAGE